MMAATMRGDTKARAEPAVERVGVYSGGNGFEVEGCLVHGRGLPAIAASATVSVMLWTGGRFRLGAVTGALQGKEARSAPGRAGDGARDRREAGIGGPLPVVAFASDRDGVALPLILAKEHRAGFELATAGAAVPREAVQEQQAVAIKPAEGPRLDVPRDHAPEQVLAQTGRGRAAELRPPAPPKRVQRKRADAGDLGRDRGRVRHRLAHG